LVTIQIILELGPILKNSLECLKQRIGQMWRKIAAQAI